MITYYYLARLAFRNLRRGGQRVLVALLCITFGIMALVAMNMLAQSIESAVQLTPAQLLGGDMSLVRKSEDAFRPEDIDQLKSLQQSGAISRYTLIAYNNTSIMLRVPGSGQIYFAGTALGIEPDQYPLAGSLTIGDPGSTGSFAASLATLLQKAGDVVITRDIAEQYHLKVGDPIVLSDLRVGAPLEGRLRGIAYDTPNHRGDKIYYSIETARKLANSLPVINTAIANSAQGQLAVAKLEDSGWTVDWAVSRGAGNSANLWVIGLRGAGILGPLVGGIGIANTMQVLLRRRQREIAIWKTLGYRLGDLRLIFSLEAAILGLSGSLLGAGLGVLISSGLLELFLRTSNLLYQWTFSPTPPLLGILIGTLTTVIFATWAIILSSQARPMALLRNEPVDIQGLPGCQSLLLGLLLAAPFGGLTSLVMGSPAAGIGVLAGIGVGILLLGATFSGLLWVCTHFLPLRAFPLVRMAFNSLRRSGAGLVLAMIALFIGALSMSMGLTVTQFSQRRISGAAVDVQGYDLTILSPAGQESAIRQAVQAQHPEKVGVGYRTALADLSVVDANGDGGSERPAAMDAILVGRSDPQDYVIHGANWGSQPEGVYAYQGANLKAGDQVKATLGDGATQIFSVVGTYDINYRSMYLYPPTGLLMSAKGFTRFAPPDSLTYFIQVPPNQVSRSAAALGAALPQATVVDLFTYAGRFMQSYQNLYLLAIVMAGLALLAGLLLVANSVSLAMLERHYEIGILKTVGYARRQILGIFAVEYGLVGLLATGAGLLVVEGLLAVVAIASHQAIALLLLSLPSLALVAVCSLGLTLLTVLGVTWNPTRVSPAIVLNNWGS
jgi:putative ABC transport system permease protein